MIVLNHTYKNLDGETVTEELRFHLRRDELAENLHLKEEFEEVDRWSKENEKRDLKPAEVRKVFQLIKELMRLTYGVLGEKGGRTVHIKNQEVWESFVEAGVYDSFIWWLFENKERANDFMEGLMPVELREDAAKLGLPQKEREAPIAPTETVVSGQKPKREVPTQEELMDAYREKMQRNAAEAGEG